MEQIYPVTINGDTIGTVKMYTEGLYYLVQCTCRLPRMQRVSLFVNHKELGILIPENDVFRFSKRIPRKNFSEDPIHFYLIERDKMENGSLIAVSADRPFSGINRLQEGKFVQTDDGPMIQIPTN